MYCQHYEVALAQIVQGDLALRPFSKKRGVWRTFGGKIESGETPEAAISASSGRSWGSHR
jgi:hypothetical protein